MNRQIDRQADRWKKDKYIYTYIYIYRERERERETDKYRDKRIERLEDRRKIDI